MNLSGVYIFEDDKGINLEPVTAWNAPWDILFGCFSLLARTRRIFPDSDVKGIRLGEEVTLEKGRYLFLNSRLLSLPVLADTEAGCHFVDEQLALLIVDVEEPFTGELLPWLQAQPRDLPSKSVDLKLANFFWNYTQSNGAQIVLDGEYYQLGSHLGEVHERACMVAPEKIYLGKGSSLAPGVVLDAHKGPIIIEDDVEIAANAVLVGPIFIDKESTINPLTTVRPEVSLGFHCKVGGEVASCIVMPFTSKAHHGYLARSMVGSWCNLGAGSATSTLKNTYGDITFETSKGAASTGLSSLGCLIGDHVKIGTNVTLSPGASVGAFSNVFGVGSVSRFLPSFSWYDSAVGLQEYKIAKLLDVVVRVLARRKEQLSPQYRKHIEDLYARSKQS